MKIYSVLLMTFILATMLAACSLSSEPIQQQVQVGQTQQEIIEAVGEPDNKEIIVKNVEHIFGPAEGFWDELPMGTELEIWDYEDRGGYLYLYFIDGSDVLEYKAFAPEGVVY